MRRLTQSTAFSLVNLLIAVAAPVRINILIINSVVKISDIHYRIMLQPQFANWLTTPQRVFHSLLCTRIMLHIRAFAAEDGSYPTTITQASMEFNPGASPAGETGVTTVADTGMRKRKVARAAKGKGRARRDGLSFDSAGFASEFATASLDFGGESAWSDATTSTSGSGGRFISATTSASGSGSGSCSGSGYGPSGAHYDALPLTSAVEVMEMQSLKVGRTGGSEAAGTANEIKSGPKDEEV